MIKNQSITFIVEGDKETGLGHFYRSLVLGRKLKQSESEVKFLIIGNINAFKEISKNEFEAFPFTGFENEILKKADKVVLDLFSAENSFLEKIKSASIPLCGLGFPEHQLNFFDITVNVADGKGPQNERLEEKDSVRLRGAKYSLLRDNILSKREQYNFRGKISKILIMFGGADPLKLSEKISDTLSKVKREIQVCFVLGKLNSSAEEKIFQQKFKTEIIKNTDNIADLMLSSDLVIGSPGNGLFEAWVLGLPYLGFFQNKQQEYEFKNFPNLYNWGENFQLENVFDYFESQYDSYKKFIKELKVGTGSDEIIELLKK